MSAFMSQAEAAELLGLPKGAVLQLVKDKKLPGIRLSRKRLVLPRVAVMRQLGLAETPGCYRSRPHAGLNVSGPGSDVGGVRDGEDDGDRQDAAGGPE